MNETATYGANQIATPSQKAKSPTGEAGLSALNLVPTAGFELTLKT